jgi:hypothetical protein
MTCFCSKRLLRLNVAIYIKHGSTLTEMTDQPYDAEDVL